MHAVAHAPPCRLQKAQLARFFKSSSILLVKTQLVGRASSTSLSLFSRPSWPGGAQLRRDLLSEKSTAKATMEKGRGASDWTTQSQEKICMHGQIALLSRSWSRDSGPGSLGLRADDNFLVHLHDQSQYKLITSGQPLDARPSCVARLLLGAGCAPAIPIAWAWGEREGEVCQCDENKASYVGNVRADGVFPLSLPWTGGNMCSSTAMRGVPQKSHHL